MVGRPTVTIPFCILLRIVIPVTVVIIVSDFHRERGGYVTASVVRFCSSSRICDNSISAEAEEIAGPACIEEENVGND
jgi:ABC-type methionine transport system permease subunit